MEHFSAFVSSIRWKDDTRNTLPGAKVDRIPVGHPSLAALAKVVVRALCIEKGQVIVGVPSRGIVWAAILANAGNVHAIFLQKVGMGVPLSDSTQFAAYNNNNNNTNVQQFTMEPDDEERVRKADVVWVADDVCESGNTLATIYNTLETRGCQDVRLLPLLTFKAKLKVVLPLYSVIECDMANMCYPGPAVFTHPDMLYRLRGTMGTFVDTRVYGPSSMSHLVLDYVHSTPGVVVGDVCWDRFEGGLPNVTFEMPPGDVVFLYDAQWMDTLQDGVVHALARNCRGKMTVIIPFLGAGTCERTDREGVLATAQTALFSLCASMPLTFSGPVQVVVYDIHATAARFYTTDRVQYVSRQALQSLVPSSVDTIAFPDGGALSRFRHLFMGRKLLVFTKVRQDGQRKIYLSAKVGPCELNGSTVFIVDDLVRTGGTILETAKILRSMGATRVGAAFVHADFDPGKTIPFVKDPLLDCIVTTNSVPAKARALWLAGPKKVVVKSVFHVERDVFANDVNPWPIILASASDTKLQALRKHLASSPTESTHGIYTGAVPSGVPEQPIGREQGYTGATNRLEFVHKSFPGRQYMNVVAMESTIDCDKDGNRDVALALCKRNTTPTHCVGPFVPQGVIVSSDGGPSVGEQLQKLYDLPSKDAWIGYFSGDATSRTDQLVTALKHAWK